MIGVRRHPSRLHIPEEWHFPGGRRDASPLPARFLPFLILLATVGILMPGLDAGATPVDIPIVTTEDDGEEIDNEIWLPDVSLMRLGSVLGDDVHDLGFRFMVPELAQVDSVLFARLRFPARGGEVVDGVRYVVRAALETSPEPLSQERRPSQLLCTQARVISKLAVPWIDGASSAMFAYSDDLSAVINEVLSLPGWGDENPVLILCVDDSSAVPQPNFVICQAFGEQKWPVTLQVCRTLPETFIAHEILSRPTDQRVVVNFASLVALESYVEFGIQDLGETTVHFFPDPGEACLITLDGLESDTLYQYRLRYRLAGTEDAFEEGEIHTFRTQRPPGSTFTFTTQADSHISEYWLRAPSEESSLALYETTLENVAADAPDFHFSLGDFSETEYARSSEEAWTWYECQRRYLGGILHSIPFYLVLGNHEGELGWFWAEGDSVPVWSEEARRRLFPNPFPDDFYSGCPDPGITGAGYRESYYAWEWGDALFVVLDPFWYTIEAPHHNPIPEEGGGWAWTLGWGQYEWLNDVLGASDRQWKIVLIHHLVGGIEYDGHSYGRGGTEVVDWEVANKPTFEWGGQDESGAEMFADARPGWGHGPIHDMLVQHGVNLVLHGHDHFFALQQHDRIVYLLCPRPMDAAYEYGAMEAGGYGEGLLLPNSGHLRFTVSPDDIVVEYVRAFLEGDGTNGEVAVTYTVADLSAVEGETSPAGVSWVARPNPVCGQTIVRFLPVNVAATVSQPYDICDLTGRTVIRLDPGPGATEVHWDACDQWGRRVPAGVYFCRNHHGASPSTPFIVIR